LESPFPVPEFAKRYPVDAPAGNPLSQIALKIADAGLVTLLPGTEHLLEIGFDGRLVGKSFHFGPELPLVFHW
jgi:hypothetical protein